MIVSLFHQLAHTLLSVLAVFLRLTQTDIEPNRDDLIGLSPGRRSGRVAWARASDDCDVPVERFDEHGRTEKDQTSSW